MQQHYDKADFPYHTGNAALAFSLYIAGIPFADRENPLTNSYDAKILRGLGYEGEIEEAAAKAFADGKKGEVEYGFAQTLKLGDAIEGFDHAQSLATGSEDQAAIIVSRALENLAGGRVSQTATLSHAAGIVLKRWRTELAEWENHRDYGIQKQKHVVSNYDAQELAEKTLFACGFHPFAAVIMDARKVFLRLHLNYPFLIRMHRAGKPNHDGERVKLPGFLYFTENAERETRRNLGVRTK